eukprot:5647163-Lingulodinium_polyedra.AAC.1
MAEGGVALLGSVQVVAGAPSVTRPWALRFGAATGAPALGATDAFGLDAFVYAGGFVRRAA